MCSILGSLNPQSSLDTFAQLNATLSHRGPDNASVEQYIFQNKPCFLAHNRLAIQDLDPRANQPMENERFIIVFNGEIYNHFELRKELIYTNFQTHSDTETLLYCFLEWGFVQTLHKLNGMFAIGLLDKYEHKLYLARDRVGIKPLYYAYQNGEFSFASQPKGLSSSLRHTTSGKSIIQFMSLGYIPNDKSYFRDICKLPPAHYLIFDGAQIHTKRYWDVPQDKISVDYQGAIEQTEQLLRSSIKYRLLADVKVGSFLSGGVDSSLVSAIMSQEASSQIKTFSIGFEDVKYDESSYAREVAKHLNSEHFEYICTPSDILSLASNLDTFFDEPFGDASSLPMMLLSQITGKQVSVALSGDGGDELFLGYDRYFLTQKYHSIFNKIPPLLRTILSSLSKYSSNDKLTKLRHPLRYLSKENLYTLLATSIKPWELTSLFHRDFIEDNFSKVPSYLDLLELPHQFDTLTDFSRVDFYRYLPDDILTKVDRATMAYGLEARVPLLDHRLVEFAFSLPEEIKLQHGAKSILKSILHKYIPDDLINRPKKGFSVPLKHWFRNELKDLLLAKVDSLDERFNKPYIYKLIKLHCERGRNYEYVFWNLLRIP